MADTLLPQNAAPFELAEEGATARLSVVPVPIRDVWNADKCPVDLLPWLAWSLAVGEWDSGWPEATKRAVIKSSTAVHRIKGTVASVKRALAAAGYPDAIVIEGGGGAIYHNGAFGRFHNGLDYHGDPLGQNWARYRVKLPRPITTKQAEQVRRILENTAPARCQLSALEFLEVAATHDGTIKHNGEFTRGVI